MYIHKKVNDRTRHLLKNVGTIVFIKGEKYPAGHYLVKGKKGWMDSWINFPIIVPAKAGFHRKLPGNAQWIIYQIGENKEAHST